jgi:hypothetical protein
MAKGEPTPEEEKLMFILKLAFIPVIFAIALGFGVLPAKVKSCGRNPKFMSMANSFSGGLFLAIALVHILPDVVKDWNEYNEPPKPSPTYGNSFTSLKEEEEDKEPFPLPFILVFCGYTFILLVDKVMFDSHALFDHGHGDGHGHGHGHGHGDGHGHGSKEKHGHEKGHGHDHGAHGHDHMHENAHKRPPGHEHEHEHERCI